jgi:hypothetical protein
LICRGAYFILKLLIPPFTQTKTKSSGYSFLEAKNQNQDPCFIVPDLRVRKKACHILEGQKLMEEIVFEKQAIFGREPATGG